MPTISQLTAVTSVQDTDQVPVYSTDNGDARKASMSVIKAYILIGADFTDATFTNPVLIAPNIGTPTYGNLINCFNLPLSGVTGVLGLVNGGSGSTTADGALTNFGGTTIGKAVFTAATATDAQNALGATTIGKALFTASDATAGRTAISAAKSGSNSDITALTGLAVPLASVALTFAIAAAL